tara:strand:- start:14771 stop:15625 length:855 start_codon:yes stop_codon:yes gene_type:complete
MEAHGDRNWLRGDPEWWGLSSSSDIPSLRGLETSIPVQFTIPSKVSRFGWARQRMRPLAWPILKPVAWSPFFLISSIFPLIFTGRTPDDQIVSGALFVFAWILLIIPVANARNAQPTSSDDLLKLPVDWSSLFLGTVLFFMHILYSPIIGWASYAVFWVAFIRSIMMISEVFSIPPARLILPVDRTSWSSEQLNDDWNIFSKRWQRGEIASLALGDEKMVLHGLSRGNDDFISLSCLCRFGFVQDLLFEGRPHSERILTALDNLPFSDSGVEWPNDLVIFEEEE